jgi:ankyrin repeat protein
MLAAENSGGFTALHYAAKSEHDVLVQLLLREGAAVDARSHIGITPLMQAQLVSTVRVLFSAHADANAADANGRTVLHYCARQGAAASVYRLLLQHGAVPAAVDVNGSTAAHIAGMAGYFADEALLSKAADEYSKVQTAMSASEAQGSLSSRLQQQCHITSATDSSGASSSSSSGSSSNAEQASSGIDSVEHSSSSNGDAAASSAASSEVVDSSVKQKKQKVNQPCANCSKLTTKLCRRCAAVHYCSTECQKVCFKDAKHRAQCEEVASAIL